MTDILDFIPNVSIPGVGTVSIRGVGTKSLASHSQQLFLERLTLQETLQIIVERLIRRQNPGVNANPSISTVFGQPDFLPFPFLSLGIKRGAAVCRLIREFSSNQSAQLFIDTIRQVETVRGKPFSLLSLAEICCIDVEQARQVFEIARNQQADDGDIQIDLQPTYFFQGLKRIPVATGFLVGRNKLLTNFHVFPKTTLSTLDEAIIRSEYVAQFNYEQDMLGREAEPLEYRLDECLICDQELDFALIKLVPEPEGEKYKNAGHAGDQFGWIPLLEDNSVIAPPLPEIEFNSKSQENEELSDSTLQSVLKDIIERRSIDFSRMRDLKSYDAAACLSILKEKALLGDSVNIIQHPKGRRKEIVLSSNRVRNLFKNFILYEADADYSSSGSPVMNQQWQLVGLHCGALLKSGQPGPNNLNKPQIDMEIGIRTCQIVEFLISKLQADLPSYEGSDATQRLHIRDLWFFVKEYVQLGDSKETIPSLPGFEDIEVDYKPSPAIQQSTY